MPQERALLLEQALVAVGKKATSIDEACALAIGGIMSVGYWQGTDPQCSEGAGDEIEKAMAKLCGKRPSMDLKPNDRWFSAC